jgi:hypothetical protein
VDWITANGTKPAVVNMSLGGSKSPTLDDAVNTSIAAGFTYSIAAGNSATDACQGSPSDVANALVVGATDQTDTRAPFSNFGTCLDLFAPGVNILSDFGLAPFTKVLSGTSMAAPHVAGVAAQYLEGNPGASPATVAGALTCNATVGVVGSPNGSPNLLLYGGSAPSLVPDAPSLTAIGDGGSVNLSWTVPGGGSIDHFTLARGTASGNETTLACLSGSATTYDDSAVVNGTTYYYRLTASNAIGSSVASLEVQATPSSTGTFAAVAPARLLDTRVGIGAPTAPVPTGSPLTLQVAGRGNVPAQGLSAVVMNVTVTNPTSAGFATVYPADLATPPLASNLNFAAGQVVPNLVTVKLSPSGAVKLVLGGGGTADLVADVFGYYNDGSVPAATGARFKSAAPTRILDSRDGTGGYSTPWSAGTTRALTLTGVPNDATAVVLNVTATNTTQASFATMWASDAQPFVSNLNYVGGQIVANLVVVGIGANHKVNLFNQNGTVDFVADLAGWFGGSQANQIFTPVTPTRILDSRDGTGGFNTPWHTGTTRNLTVGSPVPISASAVVVNITATRTTSPSFVTVWPAGLPRPLASNLNFVVGQVVPNLVMVPLGSQQQLSLFNNAGDADLIADVDGYFSQ